MNKSTQFNYLPLFPYRVLSDVNFKKQFENLPEFTPEHAEDDRTKSDSSACKQVQSPSKIRSTQRHTKAADITQENATSHSSLDALAEAALQHNRDASTAQQEPAQAGGDTESHLTESRKEQRRVVVMRLLDEKGYFPPDNVITEFQQEHSELFPNKNSLLIKVREIRQKCLNQAS